MNLIHAENSHLLIVEKFYFKCAHIIEINI